MKAGVAAQPIAEPARSDLVHHVDAISRALKDWNDLEALKLLRLHWREIADAIHELAAPEAISLSVSSPNVQPSGDGRLSEFDDVADHSADDDVLTPAQRRSATNLRTFSRV